MNIAVAFATLSGNTSVVANYLAEHLRQQYHQVDSIDLAGAIADTLKCYDLVFLGGSTYGDGDLNPISEMFFQAAQRIGHNCGQTRFAIFSLGDSLYPNFSKSGEISADLLKEMDAVIIGEIHRIDGYPDENTLAGAAEWADNILKIV